MSDPETTIRVESCRGDGCPVCGERSAFPFRLPCGCSPCLASACSINHLRDLLTEALRQRDARISPEALHVKIDHSFEDIRPLADATDWSDPFDFLIHETWKRSARVEALREERDAAIRQLKALDLCTVCAGTGKPVSGKPCICGGHGGIGNQITGLTREAQRAHEKAAQFEADWMAAKYEFGVTLTAERERAEKAEATVARQAQRIQQQEVAWSASQARAEKAEALLLECREAVDYAAWAADEESDEPHMKKFRDLLSRLPTLKEP